MVTRPVWPERLLSWFRQNGRTLAWREDRTPYTTWVSEAMLQQTKVETARAYYTNWLERFPTPRAVAEASESDVLHAWQGLGYYARARHLQQAMREVVARYDGEIPSELEKLRKLPGVGPYMAGAIRSLAFGYAEPAVDGNVLRVFARLYGLTGNVLTQETRRQVTELVLETIPPDAPGAFNEALMDLGALVCVPKRPHCTACPLRDDCKAYKTGRTAELPLREKKTTRKTSYIAVALLRSGRRYLLRRRPGRGLLAGMWEFPSGEGRLLRESKNDLAQKYSAILKGGSVWRHRHLFSHRIWEMRAYRAAAEEVHSGKDMHLYEPDEFLTIPLAGPHAKLAAAILAGKVE